MSKYAQEHNKTNDKYKKSHALVCTKFLNALL